MADRRDERWEARADRAYTDFTDRPKRTAAKWFFAVLAVILVLAVLGAALNWLGAWGNEAARVTSPQNVREQNTQIIEAWENMDAIAANTCQAQQESKQEEGDPTLLEDPSFAYAAQYRSERADYNRRMANLYEAQAVRGLPLPSNLKSYPKVAPTLEEKQAEVC